MSDRNEEIPYRSPVSTGPTQAASTEDEKDYRTLIETRDEFGQALAGLFSDFNSFSDESDPVKVGHQIAARKLAYEILEPLHQKLQDAIDDVDKINRPEEEE